MATYTVDTTSDTVDAGDGVLSLREALALADTTEAADTIQFAAAVQGDRIVLAGSQLTVASDVTIDGGAGVTLDANEQTRVLLVQGAALGQSNDVVLQHLVITGGHTVDEEVSGNGGGVSAGLGTTLALDHIAVFGNSSTGAGGGIYGQSLTLTDSTVSGNTTASIGGGIDASGSVALTNSTVSGNSAAVFGGGINAFVSAVLTNSTVNGNSANGDGGGIEAGVITLDGSTVANNRAGGNGGGIEGQFSTTITNSTVANNNAVHHGGGISALNASTLTNSTITGNHAGTGGGIYGGYVTLANCIVAGNAAPRGTDVTADMVNSNGLNVFGSSVIGDVPSDRENVSPSLLFAALDPLTGGGVLADNGGPTQTIALRDAPDNPALGRADPEAAPVADQRGEARPQPTGTAPDVGAFELNQSHPIPPPIGATFVVSTTSDITADDGQLTLREALALADSDNLTKDRIEFAAVVQGGTITLAGHQLTVHSDVTIDGGSGVTVDAGGASRVIMVQGPGTDVALEHLTITGGRSAESGGGIRALDGTTLTLDYATLIGNHAAYGGGISGDTVALTDSTVSGNSAYGGPGGGIYGGGVVALTDSTVSSNSAYEGSGGGIYGRDIVVTLTDSTVSGNSVTGDFQRGGGIYGGHIVLSNSTVSGNSASGDYADGGGVAGYHSVALINTTVVGNNGGGIFTFADQELSMANSIVAGNTGGSAPDVSSSLTASNGHNIFGSHVDGAVASDLQNVPASLLFAGGLSDNGGPTETVALRDAVDNPALVSPPAV